MDKWWIFVLIKKYLITLIIANEQWEVGQIIEELVHDNQLATYKHHDFWQPRTS